VNTVNDQHAPVALDQAGEGMTQGGIKPKGRNRARWVVVITWLGTVLLALGAWAAALTLSWRDHQDTLARAQRDSSNLARIIAEQTTRAIAGTDRILGFLAYDLGRLGLESPALQGVLRNATQGSDLLLQLAYTNAAGDVLQSSVDGPLQKVNLADREHFRVHREGKVEGLFISRPVRGRVSGKWSIQLSRRITNAEGGFGGMIVASVDPFYFTHTFDDLDLGRGGVISIFGRDGILRARTDMTEEIVGQDLSGSEFFAATLHQPQGFSRMVSSIDHQTRLTSFRSLPQYPLIVSAGFAEDEFLAETNHRRQTNLIVAGLVTAMLLGIAVLVTWQSRAQQHSYQALNRAAIRLHLNEEKLSDILETATDWFWEMDAELRFTSLSRSFTRFYHTTDGIIGRRREEIAQRRPGDELKWQEYQDAIVQRREFRNFEYHILDQNGQLLTWSVSGKPVFDENGLFAGYRGSGSNITDQRRAEHSLADSERRYRAMFEAVGQALIVTDDRGLIVGFNPAAERLFGYAEAEVSGHDVAMLMPEPQGRDHGEHYRAFRDSGRTNPVPLLRELTIRRADGSTAAAEISLSCWRSEGRPYFIGVVLDVTKAKQLAETMQRAREAAEHANRMKSEFLATISHEIRTPMNGVLGTLTLLGQQALEPQQHHLVALGRQSAEGLLGLLDDILDFSKLESGKITLDQADFSPAQVLESVVSLLRPRAQQQGLALSWRVHVGVPEVVVTDPGRWRQILFNLIGNAIKFTESGAISVEVRRGPELDQDQFRLETEVEDSGIGIPAAALPTLFDRFTQADSSITRRFGGTGLGLAICRELTQLLGGDIEVISEPGRGSLFRFWVACRPGDPALAPEMASDPEPGASLQPLPPLSVLVVDDNSINRDIMRALLEQGGHKVTTAPDGAAAVQQAGANRFDVILMDLQMPGLDGLSATRLIRALPAPNHAVPVIAVTAHASDSSGPECFAAGMQGFVTKPVRLKPLFTELAAVLRQPAPGDGAQPLAADAPAADALLLAAGDALSESSLAPAAAALAAGPDDAAVGGWVDQEQVELMASALGPEDWQATIGDFAHSATREIAAIHQALAQGESPRQPAHTLKGVAWNIGAQRLGDLAYGVEQAEAAIAAIVAAQLEAALAETLPRLRAAGAGNPTEAPAAGAVDG